MLCEKKPSFVIYTINLDNLLQTKIVISLMFNLDWVWILFKRENKNV